MEQLAIFEFQPSTTPKRNRTAKRATAAPGAGRQIQAASALLEMNALLTSREAAKVLKIHPKVLERMAKRREIPALKVGKFWRYSSAVLDAWIKSRLVLSDITGRYNVYWGHATSNPH